MKHVNIHEKKIYTSENSIWFMTDVKCDGEKIFSGKIMIDQCVRYVYLRRRKYIL